MLVGEFPFRVGRAPKFVFPVALLLACFFSSR